MANKTILFADDSATMRAIVEKTFAAEPFDVVAVPSGEAAIAKAKETRPDVMIVDVGLAGVTGYDVCEAARKDSSLDGVPVIMLSGVSHIYDSRKGEAVGVDEHMKKPFDTTQLIETVETLAGRAPTAKPIDLTESKAEPIPASIPKATPVPAPEPEPVEEEAEVEPIPDDDEDAFTPDALTSLDSPLEMEKPSKQTKDYPRPSSKPEEAASVPMASAPAPVHPEPDDEADIGKEHTLGIDEPEEVVPEVEPIEIKPADPVSESFQVGTLAELAQVDNQGTPLEVDAHTDAIELDDAAPSPSAPDRISLAAKEVAESLPGATPEQIAAVQSLTAEIIERVVWEVVPDLAETMIKEELSKLLKE